MSFTESNLLDGEKIVYRAKLHWCIFFKPFLFFVVVVFLDRFFFNYSSLRGSSLGYILSQYREITQPIRIFLWFLLFLYLGFVVFDFITTEIFVTNKRITRKKGIISRKTLDIKLSMIEAVVLNQGIIGRLFNYGHVYVTGVGAIISKFQGIYNPLFVRNVVIKQITPSASVQPGIRRPS